MPVSPQLLCPQRGGRGDWKESAAGAGCGSPSTQTVSSGFRSACRLDHTGGFELVDKLGGIEGVGFVSKIPFVPRQKCIAACPFADDVLNGILEITDVRVEG